MIPIAVLASGRGSNFEAIAESIQAGALQAKIVAVLSDQPRAPVLEKAAQWGIPHFVIPSFEDRKGQEEAILRILSPLAPRFLILAGYLRIVGPTLLEAFRSEKGYVRMVNIHPSLLPVFPGLGSYAQAFRYGVKVAGVTVHLVEAGVDTGPICAQEAFSIADCTSEEEVERRGLEIEHRLFSHALQWILPEKFEISLRDQIEPKRKKSQRDHPGVIERRICVCPN